MARRKRERIIANNEVRLFSNYEQVATLHTVSFTVKETFVRAGIMKEQLTCLKNVLALDYFTLSCMLAITERTIHMKKEDETFSHIISDRIMGIAELYGYGYKVFSDGERFNTWMKLPNRYFHGRTPIELMDTQVGAQKVKDEIRRFEVGTF
ncbi:antitoxin Xre/MbcA/ParS toxin-binding domain-containing protein [Chitinophaga niabensis]|uniref:Putative toxin-antitoxin system antitoxin component, TIGR02293 family n=1 Tax=Chitinophaga niabensis TaxID=536979 RepID=A0A1N6KAY3_9BACT|nr:antitoxin Xre/MbcA/ParS toxin-binding domain-containing protein [Chitinophaga niabensis]SIO53759.1 putative toxin-antitoxin system antitoxin component, TIGR02293 family [Chitinophaga niabensis]